MRRQQAALGSTLFFLAAPGIVAGAVPWWITRWRLDASDAWPDVARVVGGLALVAAGLFVLVRAFWRFVSEGAGTPAPVAPTERLVIGGDYRYVRNPMYVAVVAIVVSQALLFGSAALAAYAAGCWLAMAAFVRWHEEPVLRRRFGAEYDAYCRAVPAWRPRLRPWVG